MMATQEAREVNTGELAKARRSHRQLRRGARGPMVANIRCSLTWLPPSCKNHFGSLEGH